MHLYARQVRKWKGIGDKECMAHEHGKVPLKLQEFVESVQDKRPGAVLAVLKRSFPEM